MATYSLILRQSLGRKLNIDEVDGNFLYLKNLALISGGGGTGATGPVGATGPAGSSGPDTIHSQYFIPIGTGSGLTSSNILIFNYDQDNFVVGSTNSIGFDSNHSSIIGGLNNQICNSCNSIILGGNNLMVCNMNDTVLVPNLATATVSNATASQWKFGKPVASSVSLDSSQYIEVMIDGVVYKLAISL